MLTAPKSNCSKEGSYKINDYFCDVLKQLAILHLDRERS